MSDFLVAGLGNPGAKYENTRHNIGFVVADLLAERAGAVFSGSSAPEMERAEFRLDGNRVIILKPLTYMNRSGDAVARVQRFFKVPLENMLVIHDDLDMRYGRIKLVRRGGAGGHNGVRSIISSLGSREFPRLKIGIGRPRGEMPVDRYVLSRFTKDEANRLPCLVEFAADAACCWMEHGIQEAMNRFNGKSVDL